ncbi:MAG: hypothetical protein P1U64_05190 [Alcanivoracaceae bacterium]|jgi:hypothetical protein|nr:hypothetical protein [Alcanivoracaceae bacterium]
MRANIVILLLLASFAIAWRLVPHDWNITPMAALALFAGARLRQPLAGMALALVAMFASDLVLGFYPGFEWVYAGMLAAVVVGSSLKGRSLTWFAGGAVVTSLLFFALSNLGVWLSGTLYPLTATGLLACFTAALPFLLKSLVGNLLFTGLFYAVFTASDARSRVADGVSASGQAAR